VAIVRRVLIVIATIAISTTAVTPSIAATNGNAIAWASLGIIRPSLTQSAGWGSPIAAQPRITIVGWCSPKGVEIASRSGQPTLISDESVGPLLKSSHLGIQDAPGSSNIAVTCDDVALDPSHSKTVYAGFEASKGGSIPPVYNVAFVTSNLGRSWRVVPPPRGYSLTDFAGFVERPNGVELIYSRNILFPLKLGQSTTFVSATSPTGGKSWIDTSLGCPAGTPCMIFGPQAPQGACGMSEWQQSVLVGAPGEGPVPTRWRSAGVIATVSQCGSQQLVATTSGVEFLVDRSRADPLLYTRDGIKWTTVTLPTIKGLRVGGQFIPFGEVMTLAANGALIAVSGSPLQTAEHLEILEPGSRAWCTTNSTLPAATRQNPVTAIQSSESKLVVSFFAPIRTDRGRAVTALTIPLATLRCRT
jgi:hypothetical protein